MPSDVELEFKINTDFADKYEKKKRHEELSKLQEKYGDKSDVSESSTDSESEEEEDENGELVTPEIDAKILDTIYRIRAKDSTVYDPNAKFFGDEDFEPVLNQPKEKKTKPMYLADYQRKKLLEEADLNGKTKGETKLSHLEEQEQLKEEMKAVFNAESDEDSEEDFIIKKQKTDQDVEKEETEYKNFLLENLSKHENAKENMLEWFDSGRNEKANEEEKFIMEYILNRGWVEKEKKKKNYEQVIKQDEEDEECVEKMEEFEFKHNFRFEQEGANQVVTHARVIEDSARRPDESRKLARQSRKERKEEEERKKREELKRLKNLKAAEIKEKLEKLGKVSSAKDDKLQEIDLDEDFDPEKYDAQMSKVFDDEYYKEDEGKPVFDDDLDDLVEDEKYQVKEKVKLEKLKKGKEKIDPLKQAEIEKIMDEYYQLDYEDMVGDLPCRFKYRKVNPTTFGLTVEDILSADDKALNNFVSLKKLAPYRPPEKEQEDIKKCSKKKRLREFYEAQKKPLDTGKEHDKKHSKSEKKKSKTK